MIIVLLLGNSDLLPNALLIILSYYVFGDLFELTSIPNAHRGFIDGDVFPSGVPDLCRIIDRILGALRFTPPFDVFLEDAFHELFVAKMLILFTLHLLVEFLLGGIVFVDDLFRVGNGVLSVSADLLDVLELHFEF